VQAALGLSQLGREPELRRSRAEIATAYHAAFASEPGLRLPAVRSGAEHAWHLYVVQLQTERLRCDRDRFAQALREEGIVPSVHFIPYHQHPVGRALPLRQPLRRTDAFAARCLSLPLFPHMLAQDQADVVEAVQKLLRYYAR
jgi:dTDP-4-amino-4,6-dideoxygalactose transaminase